MAGSSAETGSTVGADLSRAISVVRLYQIDFSVSPYGAEVTGTSQLRDTWSSRMICCRPWRSSQGRSFQKLHSLEQSDTERRYAWRRCDEPKFLIEQHHSGCLYRQLEPNWDWLVKMYMPVDRSIEPLSPHQTRLHNRPLKWQCIPKVSTSTKLLHCRI